MARILFLATLSAASLVGGCTIRIVPPLQGSVVDAATGAPIESATVKVRYFNSTRTDRTDSQGRFSFGAKHMLVTFVPVHLDRVSGFTVNVEADRYHPTDLHSRGHPASSSPEAPPGELDPSWSGGHKITYTGRALVIAPIQLAPVTDTAP